MSNTENKSNVFFTDYVPAFSPEKPSFVIPCGYWPRHKIYTFISNAPKNIPGGSCIKNMYYDESIHDHYDISQSGTQLQKWTTKFDGLTIGLKSEFNKNCGATSQEQCIKNLINGKCKDKFVIKNIGIFAGKYKDEEQR